MSMTLILWKAPVVDDPDEAKKLLEPWYETEDDSAFEPSPDIAKVANELRRLYPWRDLTNEETVAQMSEDERQKWDPGALKEIRGVEGGEPWADLPFYESDRLLSVDIRWSADDAVIDDIIRLAREHELVLYDPQGPDVWMSTDPIAVEPAEFPGFKLMDWLKIGGMVAALSAVTYAAWLIPVGWLKWPAVLVAGFFALAAWFVLVAMMFGRQIMEAGDARP